MRHAACVYQGGDADEAGLGHPRLMTRRQVAFAPHLKRRTRMITAKNNRSWAVGALVLSAFLVGGAAQMSAADSTGKQAPVKHSQLTDKQAKSLAATAETKADHQKLVAYFEFKAANYDADAKHHQELAEVYRTTGGVSLAGKSAGAGDMTRTSGHCEAIAKSLRDAAKSSREIAADHERMAEEAKK